MIHAGPKHDNANTKINATDYKSNMYGQISFDNDAVGSKVIFHSYELVKIAQEVLKEGTWDNVKPNFEYPIVPNYKSYSNQIDDQLTKFLDDLFDAIARNSKIKPKDLKTIMGYFKTNSLDSLFQNKNIFKQFISTMQSIDKTNPLINKPFDDYILPAQLKVSSSIQGLLGLSNYLQTEKEPINGLWITLGKRLILIKHTTTQNGKHLYVNDHGSISGVLEDTTLNLLNCDDQGRKNAHYSFSFMRFYKQFLKNEEELFKKRFFILFNQRNTNGSNINSEELFFELTSPKRLASGGYCIGDKINSTDPNIFELSASDQGIFENIQLEDAETYEEIFATTLEKIRFMAIQVQTYATMLHGQPNQATVIDDSNEDDAKSKPKYSFNPITRERKLLPQHFIDYRNREYQTEQNELGLSAFFMQIDNIFHAQDAKLLRSFFILKEMAKESAVGSPEFLLRLPVNSFGTSADGSSYKIFSQAFEEYFTNLIPKNASEIAKEMREILKGNELSDQNLSFLPNLTASWFYSEAARNKVSILSGLILLDFIEKDIQHSDEDGNNLYSWKHTLVHPRKPDKDTYVIINDLYNKQLELGQFDGMHPMAHGKGANKEGKGSVADSKTVLATNTRLTPVQQKEGHLLTHWLYEMLKNKYTIKLEASFSNPNYKEVEKLLLPSKNNLKNSEFKRKHVLFLEIKQLMINRLSTLDCLLL
jgi:hypothetical protein